MMRFIIIRAYLKLILFSNIFFFFLLSPVYRTGLSEVRCARFKEEISMYFMFTGDQGDEYHIFI